ncbi:hypothetical protein PpBr36_08235 [Pyricularia pennisetigena]|uniref:hypothetical protein n=1 Tax=Pyricularia pennisetigena TaxID=1578925 RepID=UPI0011537507|nr:hypothetical protein PpBr36_08235 [Pyricularia pennisetigena]TLS24489.1 hypothetical protein PpBr36_08235 [Pyricularia pennisetigena]
MYSAQPCRPALTAYPALIDPRLQRLVANSGASPSGDLFHFAWQTTMQRMPKAVDLSDTGHPLPRRSPPRQVASKEKGKTVYNASPDNRDDESGSSSRLRRNSTDESNETGHSDPRQWFNQSNQNPSYDMNNMEIDSPYYQRTSGSPNDAALGPVAPPGNIVFPQMTKKPSLRPTVTQSSSADEYRSVIDDLTIENNRLKEELRRYKQFGTDLMRKDKLFEIKVHGLPGKKKRELEATLREFASTLEGSTDTSRGAKKASKSGKFKSSGGATSKHASSSSSNSRPVDSAYASMSTDPGTGNNSTGKSQTGRATHTSNSKSANQKVESYLEDIPEGLYPRYLSMTEKDKQKLVVRRLEQLFTGEMKGPSIGSTDRSLSKTEPVAEGNLPKAKEAAREAQIQVKDKKRTRDNGSSNSQSNGDGGSGGSGSGSGHAGGNGHGSGSHSSPQELQALEQRPTRPLDLDPDRIQVPSENMEYIRHLGMVPPALQAGTQASPINVSMDAEGWVYLNLLCNLAQLHIINVTPAFIRAAVSAKSTKFQLSPDGQKIRWRGGTDGTRFSSDSGNTSSRERSSTDEDDGSDKSGSPGKKRKHPDDEPARTGHISKLIRENTRSSNKSVHYKPMFVQQTSFETSGEEGSSSPSGLEGSHFGNGRTSGWDYSGSDSSPRKRRRIDGAIVYYTGAPFCTDLSGDPGDISPATYMASTNMTQSNEMPNSEPTIHRTWSGSSLPYRPFSNNPASIKIEASEAAGLDNTSDDFMADVSSNSDDEMEWYESDEEDGRDPELPCLEAYGLGGVQPEDHFLVEVITHRRRDQQKNDGERPKPFRERSDSTTASVLERIKSLKASSPRPIRTVQQPQARANMIEYKAVRLNRLDPVALPPAASFVPPFSTSSSDSGVDESDVLESEEGRDAEPCGPFSFIPPSTGRPSFFRTESNSLYPDSAYPEGQDLSQSDEEDEADSDDAGILQIGGNGSSKNKPGKNVSVNRQQGLDMHLRSGLVRRPQTDLNNGPSKQPDARTQSSVATAGRAESGYNSSLED